jgi:hypothetical protein
VLSELTPQSLTRLTWAMASTCKLEDAKATTTQEDVLSPLVTLQSPKAGLTSKDPSPFSWFSDPGVRQCLGDIAAAATPRAGEFTPDLLALLAWSFATMGHFPVDLLRAAFPSADNVGAWDRIPVTVWGLGEACAGCAPRGSWSFATRAGCCCARASLPNPG